jgi:hypothetical protein
MRCYFHLLNGHEAILDETGVEVLDLETAKAEAHRAIEELREEYDGAADEWSGWRLNVVSSLGALLYSADLVPTSSAKSYSH